MSYGFDQSFLHLNDLMMFLATVGATAEKESLISALMDDPGIETVKAGQHTVFKARKDYLARSTELRERSKASGILQDSSGRGVP